jgi:hypothetical protein
MLHEELTGRILEACFEVTDELGAGFLDLGPRTSVLASQAYPHGCGRADSLPRLRGPNGG